MKLTKTLVAQGHDGDEDGDDDAACGERIWRAETLCGCPGDEIPEGHRADEGEYEHAHHAPAHLVRDELLQKSVDDRHATDNRKAHPEDEGERSVEVSRISESDETDREE